MRHHKHSPLLCRWAVTPDDVNCIDNFDDRTLASLAGRPVILGDGVDNDNPYRALPLQRWDDRKVRS
jgi:hypothetical protein